MPLTKATQAVIAPNICTTDTAQTITGIKTFGNIGATGVITGNLTGNVTGNLTGNVTGNLTGNVTATSVSTTNLVNGSSLCFRNKIINGNFDIWQRGTSITGSGGIYSSDRWVSYGGGAGFANVINSRQTFALGQTEVPNNPNNFFRYNSNGTGVTSPSVAQRIEGVNTLAGKNITVSFWAKSSTNITASESLRLKQYFGTGGSPSSQVLTTIASNLNLTTSWQKLSFTIELPSISGKTIGSNGDDYLELLIPTGQNNINATVDIAQVQLEEGSVATPFENRSIGTELALCQRYYQAFTAGVTFTASSYPYEPFIYSFPVTMRSIPTITNQNINTAIVNVNGIFATGAIGSNTSIPTNSNFTASAEL